MAAFLWGCATGVITGAAAVMLYIAYTWRLGFKRIQRDEKGV